MLMQADLLGECVLTAIADDYENFDKIFEQTKRVAELKKLAVSRRDVTMALEKAIADRTAEAYFLSAQPSECRKVAYSRDRLDELWFYVTKLGKQKAKSFDQLVSWHS